MYRDHNRPTSWGWLVAIGVAVWVALQAGYGPQASAPAPSAPFDCERVVTVDEVDEWVDRLGGWVDYEGATGYWRDASRSVVGHSVAEDSDICSFVP